MTDKTTANIRNVPQVSAEETAASTSNLAQSDENKILIGKNSFSFESRSFYPWHFLAVILPILLVIFWDKVPKDWAEWGAFGSVFAALVSVCALIALIRTLKLQNESLTIARKEIADAHSEYDQTVVLNSKTALLNAYCHHLQWFLEEKAARAKKKPIMSEPEFRVFLRQANSIGNKHWDIIRDMEKMVQKMDEKIESKEKHIDGEQ